MLVEGAPPIIAADVASIVWRPSARDPQYPTLASRIGSTGAYLILDTGANRHAIERGAAFWMRLEGSAGVGVADALGLPVRITPLGDLPIELGLRAVPDALDVYAFEEPAFLDAGIAGLISPQRLVDAAHHAELDLVRGTVSVAEGPPRGGETLQPACTAPDGVALFLTTATIDGEQGFFLVDTGSDRTSVLLEGRFADRFDDRRRPGRHVATLGGIAAVDEVADVAVEVAGWRGAIDVDLATPAPGRCASDGTLGSDVLRHCAIRLSTASGTLDCAPR